MAGSQLRKFRSSPESGFLLDASDEVKANSLEEKGHSTGLDPLGYLDEIPILVSM
jgi:hypothetical protein